jgi:hypothetical protein
MYNRRVLVSLILVLLLWAVAGFYDLSSFAQEEGETIAITTYYPSPHGVYNELQSNKLAVGDTNGDGLLTAADQPNRNGDIRLRPQPADPATWPAGEEGQFAYSSTQDALYHYNGSTWVAQAGGGTAVMYLSCPWGVDYITNQLTDWATSCTPPSCPSGWTSVATFSECLSVACSGIDSCFWAGGSFSNHPVAVGRSVRVCVK